MRNALHLRGVMSWIVVVAMASCGDGGGEGDTHGGGPDTIDESPDGDADGDGLTNGLEGVSERIDTDRDGTPDFLDVDADGDTILDLVEGDAQHDLDGIGDWRDLDSDGDAISDAHEAGDADLDSAPIDHDGDGTPDFADPDSDDDGVGDLAEGEADSDGDGIGNWHDDDSDGDCRPDSVEGGATDSDGDGAPDFLDRDSDDDSLVDTREDTDCDGVVDLGETDATKLDSDGDDSVDLIEVALGSDPMDADDTPDARGVAAIIAPYVAPGTSGARPPQPAIVPFVTRPSSMDVYVIVDRSASMSDELASVKSELADVIDAMTCAPRGHGDPNTCIPDLWAGAGAVGFAGSGADAFVHSVDIQADPNFGTLPISPPASGCCDVPLAFGVYAALSGSGSSGGAAASCGLSSVGGRASCGSSPAQAAGLDPFGYPCFRDGALPLIVVVTDHGGLTGADALACPSWPSAVVPMALERGARVVGVLGSDAEAAAATDLRSMAESTRAIDLTDERLPLLLDGPGAAAGAAVRTTIALVGKTIPFDLSLRVDDVGGDAVDVVADLVDHIETAQLGTVACAKNLEEVDTSGDSIPDEYRGVRASARVCFQVSATINATVQPTSAPQVFRADVSIIGDGTIVLERKQVAFIVPPLDPGP